MWPRVQRSNRNHPSSAQSNDILKNKADKCNGNKLTGTNSTQPPTCVVKTVSHFFLGNAIVAKTSILQTVWFRGTEIRAIEKYYGKRVALWTKANGKTHVTYVLTPSEILAWAVWERSQKKSLDKWWENPISYRHRHSFSEHNCYSSAELRTIWTDNFCGKLDQKLRQIHKFAFELHQRNSASFRSSKSVRSLGMEQAGMWAIAHFALTYFVPYSMSKSVVCWGSE